MNYLKHLNSNKIILLFFVSFLIGCSAIWLQIHPIIIPVVVIILYGFILYVAQKKYFIDLLNSEKNSSYFLGFLFTLFALFHLFVKPEGLEEATIFRNLSIALITTIVGLIMRQVIFSYSSIPQDELDLMKSLREHLSESIEKYDLAETRILRLLEDYTELKKDILKNEKDISDEYINSLNRATGIFKKIELDFAEKIDNFTESFAFNIEEFQSDLKDIIPDDMVTNLSKRLDSFQKDYIEKLEDSISNLQASMKRISTEVIQKSGDDYVSALMEGSDVITKACKDYALKVGGYSSELAENSEKINKTYEDILIGLSDYKDKTDLLKSSIEDLTKSFNNQTKIFNKSLEVRLEKFRGELNNINTLIESFLDALNKRISSL